MASYGCYGQLAREKQMARFKNGLDAVCRCEECNDELFYGDTVYDIYGEIFCPDCALEIFNSWERTINDNDIEEE